MSGKSDWRMMDEHGRVIGLDGLPAVYEKRPSAPRPCAGPTTCDTWVPPEDIWAGAATAAAAEAITVALFGEVLDSPDTPETAKSRPSAPAQAVDKTARHQESDPARPVLSKAPSSMAPRPETPGKTEQADGLTDQERHLLEILSDPVEKADLAPEGRTSAEHHEDFASQPKSPLNQEENPAIPSPVQTHTEANMPINFQPIDGPGAQLKPRITVVGVGGAGGNAVNNMIMSGLEGVDFVVANTDAQALNHARTDRRIQLGIDVTQGLGAGARPDVGRAAAEETYEIIAKELEGSNMVFITAGMGGGTGTGAAPVISRIARDMGILTVGVVTKPFQFEGVHRMRLAETGIDELAQYVDTLIIIPNQNLFRVANERTTFADAFKMADDVLNSGVRSVTDLMVMPGLINLDFADVRTVMSGMGRAMMGTGEADGESRAIQAAEAAIANPLLEDTCMKGAGGVLINITGGPDITLFEVDEAANRIKDEVESPDAHIIFGSCFDEGMEGKMRVSVVATGIAAEMTLANPRSTASMVMGGAPRPAPLSVNTSAGEKPAAPARPQQPAAEEQPVEQPAEPEVAQVRKAAAEPQAERETAWQQQPQQATGTHGAPGVRFPQPRDTFIPRPPVAPAGRDTAAQAEPAREPQAAPQPAQQPRPVAPAPRPQPLSAQPQQRPAAPQQTQHAEEPRGRAGGLLARMTGLARRPAAPQQSPQEPEVRTASSYSQPQQHTQQPQPEQPTREQMRLNVDPDDRVQTSHEDDELEIPAFLRRQAN